MKIGIIGAQNTHARHFCKVFNEEKRHPGMAVTHLYGEDAPESAAALCAEFGIDTCRSEEEVISACDAIVVTYRKGSLHFEPVMKALKARKSVFNDKPFATDSARAEEIAEYTQSRGLMLCGGSNLKLLPALAEIKARITDGTHAIVSFAADPDSEYDGYWFYGIHSAELCVELFGECFTGVTAFRAGDTVISTVTYPGNRGCTIVNSPHVKGLHILLQNADGGVYFPVSMQYESLGPDELAVMLRSGQPPRPYSFYTAATRLTETIVKTGRIQAS